MPSKSFWCCMHLLDAFSDLGAPSLSSLELAVFVSACDFPSALVSREKCSFR